MGGSIGGDVTLGGKWNLKWHAVFKLCFVNKKSSLPASMFGSGYYSGNRMHFFGTIIPALSVCARVLLTCVAIVFIQLKFGNFLSSVTEKIMKSMGFEPVSYICTATQTSYPLSHFGSHQFCVGIN